MVSQLTKTPLQVANPEKLERIRHTCAHVMAMAVQILFPETKVTIGPTTDRGFYYDFARRQPFTPEDLTKITKQMRLIIKANLPIIREEVDRDEIKAEIEQLGESYKLEILDSIAQGATISRYYIGSPDGGRLPDVGETLKNALPEPSLIKPVKIPKSVSWWDLCAGPHVNYTGEINHQAFALESVAGAYWRGDETKAQLQRIYGTAWETPEQLEAYLQQKEEAKRRDHRLMRVRGFTQDDAHIFCLPAQIAGEILGVLNLTEKILSDFGFKDYEVNLSTRPDKSVGTDESWELATQALVEALNTKGWDYLEDKGGGAFYGPKIDVKIKDAIGRTWQCSTIQVDFNLPERFDMEYVAADGSRQRPIMIHRAIFGSLERFYGILIENYAGDFPLWLAPIQIRLLPVSEEQREYVESFAANLKQAGYRVEIDCSEERLGKQIRNAELEKIPIVAVVGKREVETQTLSIRTRQQGDIGAMTLAELRENLAQVLVNKNKI